LSATIFGAAVFDAGVDTFGAGVEIDSALGAAPPKKEKPDDFLGVALGTTGSGVGAGTALLTLGFEEPKMLNVGVFFAAGTGTGVGAGVTDFFGLEGEKRLNVPPDDAGAGAGALTAGAALGLGAVFVDEKKLVVLGDDAFITGSFFSITGASADGVDGFGELPKRLKVPDPLTGFFSTAFTDSGAGLEGAGLGAEALKNPPKAALGAGFFSATGVGAGAGAAFVACLGLGAEKRENVPLPLVAAGFGTGAGTGAGSSFLGAGWLNRKKVGDGLRRGAGSGTGAGAGVAGGFAEKSVRVGDGLRTGAGLGTLDTSLGAEGELPKKLKGCGLLSATGSCTG